MEEKDDLELKIIDAEKIIQTRILIIRGQKVIISNDIADLYNVSTKRLNEQVKRNLKRFPTDFMFQLTREEKEEVVANCDHLTKLKFSPNLPYAFTEHGVAMLSAVLNSEEAIQMSMFIVRTFIKMRESLDNYRDLALKIRDMEICQIKDHKILLELYSEIRHFFDKPLKPKKRIGFQIRK